MKIIDVGDNYEIRIFENGGLWHWQICRKGYGLPIWEGLKRSENEAEQVAKSVYKTDVSDES